MSEKKIIVLAIDIVPSEKKGGEKQNSPQFYIRYAKELFERLHHLFRKEKEIFSVEITSLKGKIGFYLACPYYLREAVESFLYYEFPHIKIHLVNDYSLNDDPEIKYLGEEFILHNPSIVPIYTNQDTKEDAMSPIYTALEKLAPDEMGSFQIVLKPINSGSFWYQLFWEIKKHVTLFFHKKDWKKKNISPKDIDAKLKCKHFSTAVRAVFWGKNEKNLKNTMKTMFDIFNDFFGKKSNGLTLNTMTKTRENIIKRFVYRRLYFPFILNIEELSSLYHLLPVSKGKEK